jgi:hypothetical protein
MQLKGLQQQPAAHYEAVRLQAAQAVAGYGWRWRCGWWSAGGAVSAGSAGGAGSSGL